MLGMKPTKEDAERALRHRTHADAAAHLGVSRGTLYRLVPARMSAERLRALDMRGRLAHASNEIRHAAQEEILRTCSGRTLAQAARMWGVSYRTFYTWLRKIPGGMQDAKARSGPPRKTIRARIYGPNEADAQAALQELTHVLSAARTGAEAAHLLGVSTATITRLRRELREVLPHVGPGEAEQHRHAMQALPADVLATARQSLLGSWVITVDDVAEPLCSSDAVARAVEHFQG